MGGIAVLDHHLEVLGRIPAAPTFTSPEPVIVQRVRLHDPLKHRLVNLPHDHRISRIFLLRFEPFQHGRGQATTLLLAGQFGANAGLDSQHAGITKRLAVHRATVVEHGVLPIKIGWLGTAGGHGFAARVIPVEQHGRTKAIVAGSHGNCESADRRVLHRVALSRQITGPYPALIVKAVFHAGPDRRLAKGSAVVFGIAMETDEVHPHFGKLGNGCLVVFRGPPVGAEGKIVKWLDPPEREQRLAWFVEVGQFREHPFIGNHVAVQVKAHAQMLGHAVCAVKRADVVAAGDQQPTVPAAFDRFEKVLLGTEARQGRAPCGGAVHFAQHGAILPPHHESTARRLLFHAWDDGQQVARPQIPVSP